MFRKKILMPLALAASSGLMLYKFKSIQNRFVWDDQSPHSRSFDIQDIKVVKTGDSVWKQITSKDPISQKTTTTFRVLSYGGGMFSDIAFGITRASRKKRYDASFSSKGKQNYLQQVKFTSDNLSKQGLLFIDGKVNKTDQKTALAMFVGQGETLTMDVDLTTPKITFTKQGSKVSLSVPLPQHYKQEPVYVSMTMWREGQCVQVVE